MKKRRMRKIQLWSKRNKTYIWIFVFLTAFPLIVDGLYALPFRQIIAIDSGDLLSYYGTAFGIFGSFITYRTETRKKKKEREIDMRPSFHVKMEPCNSANNIEPCNSANNIFMVEIKKLSEKPISYLYFYDEFISEVAKKEYSFKVTFNLKVEEAEIIKPDYNITMDPDIIDSDGYPKYIQLLCDDVVGNSWNCCYHKVKDCGRYYYYPDPFEII